MSFFLERHARHLTLEEIARYAHLEGIAPLLDDCISAYNRDLAYNEETAWNEFTKQEEETGIFLREQFGKLKRNLLELVRTSSYEELEQKVQGELTRFRVMMIISED